MLMFMIPAIVAGIGGLLEIVLWASGAAREAGVALREIYYFAAWLIIMFLSFSPGVAAHDSYRLFRTNERRWIALAALTLVFFIACSITGWGQPLLRGVWDGTAEGIEEVQGTQAYQKTEGMAQALGKRAWSFLELDNYQKVLSSKEESEKPSLVPATRRPFYGLISWTHWIVFVLLYLPTLILYGLAARREEVMAWVERRRQARSQRPAIPTTAQPGVGQVSIPGRPGWFLGLEGLIDVFAEIIGSALGSRFFGGR